MNTNEAQDAKESENPGFHWATPRRTLQIIVLSMIGSFAIKMNIGYHGWVMPHYIGSAMADGVLICLVSAILVLGLLLFTKFTLPIGNSKSLGFLAAMAIPSLCAAPLVIWRTSAGLVDQSEDRRMVNQFLSELDGRKIKQSQAARRESGKTGEKMIFSSKASPDAPEDNPDLARLKFLAQSGDPLSQALLGYALCYGTYNMTGIKIDMEEGVEWIRKSSEADHPLGLFLMGTLREGYQMGVSKWVEMDKEAARKDFEKALEMGLQHGAENGDAVWKHAWGSFLDKEIVMPRNRPEAIKWYRKAAEQGDATAGVSLGLYYYFGLGVSQDMSEGVKWYKIAAEHGVVEGARHLGIHYRTLVPREWKEAEKWYRMAAEKGDGHSASVLSNYYFHDTKNFDEAVKWCRIAIESGTWDESRLERMQYRKKLDDDLKVQFESHRKAAEQGDAIAQRKLGIDFAFGMGTDSSTDESVKWLRRSADQGDARAQAMLGNAYENGEGVPKDKVIAYMWLNLAAVSGNSEIKKRLDELTRSMSKEEVAEGQRMSREWKPKPEQPITGSE